MNTTHTPAPVEAGEHTGFWCPTHGRYCAVTLNPPEGCPWRRSNPCHCPCHAVNRPMPPDHICAVTR